VFDGKIMVFQPLKNYRSIYGTRRFITVFMAAIHFHMGPHTNLIPRFTPCFSEMHYFIVTYTTVAEQ
jgi:hypothetical protein